MRTIFRYLLALVVLATGLQPFRAGAQEEFKRKIEQVSFVPKGAWIAGVSVSYSQSDQDNYQFLIFESINGDSYSFKLSPTVMFCFKDNLAAGGRFSYQRQRTQPRSTLRARPRNRSPCRTQQRDEPLRSRLPRRTSRRRAFQRRKPSQR